ncbi:hypothetical protein [Streptomyces sp. DW26H14]|uniref:hypothetical protein n=1 Tax=Streptomyces sp. DW26H14 TaxID=3435395 RepID=UPI00403DB174
MSASCHTPVHRAGHSAENVAKVMPPTLVRRGPDGTITHLIKPGAIPAGEHLLFKARSEPGSQALTPTLVDRVPDCVPSE